MEARKPVASCGPFHSLSTCLYSPFSLKPTVIKPCFPKKYCKEVNRTWGRRHWWYVLRSLVIGPANWTVGLKRSQNEFMFGWYRSFQTHVLLPHCATINHSQQSPERLGWFFNWNFWIVNYANLCLYKVRWLWSCIFIEIYAFNHIKRAAENKWCHGFQSPVSVYTV